MRSARSLPPDRPVTGRCPFLAVLRQNRRELLSVTVANVSGIDRPDDAIGGGPEIPTGCAFGRVSCILTLCGAADDVTSGGASLVTMVQAADFPKAITSPSVAPCTRPRVGEEADRSAVWRPEREDTSAGAPEFA